MQRWNIREENGLLLNTTNNPGESNYTWVNRNEIQNSIIGEGNVLFTFHFEKLYFYIYIFLCIFNEIVSK